MKSCKKIVSCFLCIAILTSFLCVPASANDGIAGAVQDFFEWSVNWSQGIQNSFWKAIYGDSWMEDENGGWTGADRDELTARYNEYISSLQTDLGSSVLTNGGLRFVFTVNGSYWTGNNGTLVDIVYGAVTSYVADTNQSNRSLILYTDPIVAPCAGTYSVGFTASPVGTKFYDLGYRISSNMNVSAGQNIYPVVDNWNSGKDEFYVTLPGIQTGYLTGSLMVYADFVPALGVSSLTGLDITINSRPTSIVGDYGIIGDNGTIVHIEGNKIVDETGGTVYNPATGETQSYTDYAYDYSDRSYLLTLEDGNTIKVMYGDENVTIHEGDTIYNIYYLIPDDSGSGGGSDSGDTPSGEDMSWWKQAWTNFTDKLFSILGNGGSSVNPDTAPAVPDDEETGEKGYSVIDLFVVLKDGTWAFITGIVSTAYDGFTGFVESVSSAGSFFTFYDEESEDGILFVPLEGGETIWD